MEKKDIRVSDTIPQRPASFDDAVERTLASVTKKEQQKETPVRTWKTDSASTRKRGSKRSVLDIVAIAAIFVVCVVAIGTVIGVRAHLNRTGPAAEQPTPPVNMSNTVYVSTVDELLAALAPDTRIVLSDGTYNLTEASDYGTEGGQYYTWEDRSDNWFREPEENSFELCLKDLENCCITGSRNAEIVTVPRTAAVLSARNCAGLVLSDFTAGHTVMADPCEGEVIRLVECADAWVEDCSLYGCGTWGVSAVDCDNLTVTGSDIHECSSGGVSFVRCRNTLISNCLLRNCGYRDNAFSIVYIYDCKDLRVIGCDIYENRTDVLFNLYGDDVENGMGNVLILGTSVHDNEVLEQGFYSYTTRGPVVAGCEFKNNTGVLLSDEQCVFDRDGNRLYESDLLAMQLDRTLETELEAFPTLEPRPSEDPNALVPAIRVNGEMYVITEFETVAEPDESEIRYVSSVVPRSEWPTEDGQANFCEVGTPYAVTQDGLFVLYDNEWRLFEAEEFGDPDTEYPQTDVSYYYLVNNVPVYPFEHFLWESGPDFTADGMGFETILAREEYRQQIPEAEYDASMPFEILVADGWTLDEITIYNDAGERIATVSRDELPLTEYGCADPDCVTTLSPGVYYVSAYVENRGEEISKGYGLVICLQVKETAEASGPVGTDDDADKVLWNDTTAFPGLFRFWDYDEENGYSEAPAEGVLFVCDFDGDGTENEIRYEIHGSSVTFSVGKASIDVAFGAGLEQAILLDLDPDSARLNLLVVCNMGSEDYETAELHMENGRFVRGPVIWAYCNYDGETLRGAATQTDILGTKVGGRTYHGEDLTPDSEWFDCDVIPDEIQSASDRAKLIEFGKLLHLIRDLPCTIDGQDAVIPAGTYIYMTRWHESGTLAEIRTEDGTTALVTLQEADENDPDLYGYLIDGVMQFEYFDNIFFAD